MANLSNAGFYVRHSPLWVRPDAKMNFREYEEKERKEMEWLVGVTSRLVSAEGPPVGSLGSKMVGQAMLAMRAWARRSVRDRSRAPHVVEQLLHRLVQERECGNTKVVVDTSTYNVVIDAWSQSREKGAAQRAEEILLKMEREYELGNDSVRPNKASFNSVIKAWVKHTQTEPEAISKAEELIDRMTQLSEIDENMDPPDYRGHNLLLYAYSVSGLPDAADRAQAVLEKMNAKASNDDDDDDKDSQRPTVNTYNQVIKCWAKGRNWGFEDKAQALFDHVLNDRRLTATHETFNAILACWLRSKRPEARDRVLELFALMEELYKKGDIKSRPDSVTVASVVRALSRGGDAKSIQQATELQKRVEQEYDIQPSVFCNNILIDSLSKSGRRDAPDLVMRMLVHMEDAFRGGDALLKPDEYTFTSVIDTFVKSGRPDAGARAMEVLQRMKQLCVQHDDAKPPTVGVYNSVINAFANTKTRKGVMKALALLEQMESSNSDMVPRPNRVTYNTVLKAFQGNENHAERAQELFERMEHLSQTDPSLSPDVYSYVSFLKVLSRSNFADKADRAFRLVQRMIQQHDDGDERVRPNIRIFNAALNACAYSATGNPEVNERAFVVTVSTLVLLQNYTQPDSITYGTVLRACSTLLPRHDARRDDVAEKIFERACAEGRVSQMILDQLRFAASPALYKKLTGNEEGEQLSLFSAPTAWKENAVAPRRRR